MDTKTKIHTIISIVLVTLIAGIVYWMQLPSENLKAQVIDDTDTVLVRIVDYTFDPDIVRVNTNTTVSWLHDETEANADVQHVVESYDPENPSADGDLFESDYLTLGDTFSYIFEDEGVYYYNDSLYPFMTGKVCVGEGSEVLDEDCAIELTGGEGEEGFAAEEEETDEELGEELDEESEEELEEELDEEDLAALDEEDELFPAAIEEDEEEVEEEEDLDVEEDVVFTPQTTETEDGLLVINMQQQRPAAEEDKEIADSGPEHLIYILAGIISLYFARRFSRNNA